MAMLYWGSDLEDLNFCLYLAKEAEADSKFADSKWDNSRSNYIITENKVCNEQTLCL